MRTPFLALLLLFPASGAWAETPDLAPLLHAYPVQLAGADSRDLIWRDGTRMALAAGDDSSFDAMLRHGSILDMLREPYERRLGPPPLITLSSGMADDPGRIRDRAFFDKIYGDCHRGEVTPHLVSVNWLPHHWGRPLRVTAINGVAAELEAVSTELDAAPEDVTRFLYPPGGGYNCRAVADDGQASMHGWGAAIDINVAHSDYWHWQHGTAPPRPMPAVIVESFARHGFIWGGDWAHYDTMHFEYRPELLGMVAGTAE
jgi:hypothetical protein